MGNLFDDSYWLLLGSSYFLGSIAASSPGKYTLFCSIFRFNPSRFLYFRNSMRLYVVEFINFRGWYVVRWGKFVISLRAGAGSRGATKKGSSKNRPPPQGLFVPLPRTCLLCIVSQGSCLSRISFEILLTRRWKLRG